ncbi:hypothetical protein GPUN_0144 [Glaciecola punicea ACAM 611]|jgi:hypothetical protein|uniref:Uncharacterized protein n=1 Tax=Glaciecola punicea ACAM 611 TaxID=1121923 RepID=H5T7M1_9ALTE|nr:hypothetical protein [Glaciecola punicea]OFA32918.1 hypothetical protein BAE46_04025 [Glaciecola punicea]GAB54298.1 hypothetical protein GPUN_0144 [Glaciecola punicea ACAM 611]
MNLGKGIKPLINWLAKRRNNQQITSEQEIKTSIWRDTGQVYYLLNTLKLSYESEYGPVTFESLNVSSLAALLSELNDTQHPHLKQKVTAGQTFAYSVSLCGVTWEESENSTRVKAISEAAMLRSTQSDFVHSQAVFKHESFLEHNDILNAPTSAHSGGVFTYPNISIEQFVDQLAHTNASISHKLRRRINVQPENFKRLFTEQEQSEVNALLQIEANAK